MLHVVAALSLSIFDFRSDVEAATKVFGPIGKANEALLAEGKVAESTKALLDAAPEKTRTAAQAFVLGNMLFSMDFAASYALHKKAAELAPDEAVVQYEWALERHRKREYAEAEAIYAKLLEQPGESDPRVHAWRSDCLLRLGKYAEACDEWKKADLHDHHIAVEQGFSWVYGEPHPDVKRGELLAKARGGDLAALEDAVLLDLAWKTDWWNCRPKRDYVELDLKLAEQKLAKEPQRLKALQFLAKRKPDDDLEAMKHKVEEQLKKAKHEEDAADAGDATLVAELKAIGLLGDAPKLPPNTHVANELLDVAIDQHAATADEVLKSFGVELEKRVAAGDVVAIEILAALYEQAKEGSHADQLAAVEKVGWEKHHQKNCVLALLSRNAETMKSDDPLLADALKQFPDETRLTSLVTALTAKEGKDAIPAFARHIAAMLTYLVPMPNVPSGTPQVSSGFRALEKELAKRSAPKK